MLGYLLLLYVTVVLCQQRPLPAPLTDFHLPPGTQYHNVATLGPSPKLVTTAVTRALLSLEVDPTNQYFGGSNTSACNAMEAVRRQAASALGAQLDEITIMPSTTVSLNNVAEGLLRPNPNPALTNLSPILGLVSSGYIRPGDRVLTTDQEHAGGLRAWQHYVFHQPLLAALDIVAIPVSPPPESIEEVLGLFEAALRKHRYRVVAVSHVTTTNGLRLPIQAIARLAHSHGALMIVDGAQAHGGVEVDVHSLDVDAYATSSHKWLCSAKGTGLLYLGPRLRGLVNATRFDDGLQSYTGSTGTRPQHTIAGLGAAIAYFESYGFARIEGHNMALRAVAYEALRGLASLGVRIVSPSETSGLAAPILTLALPGNVTSAEVAAAMRTEHKTIVKVTGRAVFPEEGGPTMPLQATRLSFHLFNNAAEVQQMVRNLGAVLRQLLSRAAA